MQLQLHVVIGGVRAEEGIGPHALLITTVIGIVPAAMVEVDAADERHVVRGAAGVADHDHLLVVAAQRQDALVEQHLAARLGDRPGQPPVRPCVVAEELGV